MLKPETYRKLCKVLNEDSDITDSEKVKVRGVLRNYSSMAKGCDLITTTSARIHYGLNRTSLDYLASKGLIRKIHDKKNSYRWGEKEIQDLVMKDFEELAKKEDEIKE